MADQETQSMLTAFTDAATGISGSLALLTEAQQKLAKRTDATNRLARILVAIAVILIMGGVTTIILGIINRRSITNQQDILKAVSKETQVNSKRLKITQDIATNVNAVVTCVSDPTLYAIAPGQPVLTSQERGARFVACLNDKRKHPS